VSADLVFREAVLWSDYLAAAFSGLGWSPVSLIFPLVTCAVIGVAAGFASFAFLTLYAKQP
jgi:ABC-type transport system involved in multi-copper enzyme maturation permease subunit